MPFPYKNPLNAQLLSAPYSVPRNSVQGTDYSVLGIGGWMEVANLSDLSLTFSGVGLQTLSANTVPINIYIGNGTPFNPSYVNLNSDNFSSGRRRVGMIVYVNETGFAYQYEIDNYESLWNAATGATGTVTTNLYDTQVRNNSAAGQNFINAWTGSTIEGVSGTTRTNARWRIFHGTDTFVTGGTYFSATSTIDLYRNDGVTIPISGITSTGGSSSNGFTGGTVSGATNFTGGLTANTISATTYYNLPSFTGNYLPLSGGTVTGGTIFQSGVTANTISQTSYIDFTTGSTNPSSVGGRLFFDATQKSLSYFDTTNNQVPIAVGQQLYTRVWNATGTQIDKGKVIAITGTSNNLPSAILARNVHSGGSDKPIGLAAENIPNGSEGLVLNNGVLSGITLNTFSNGDTLYLSDTVPGGYVASTTSLSLTARTNEIGYVLETGTTTGKIYVNINNEDSNLTLTDIERNILEGNVISTGTYEYTGMTINSSTTVNVAPMRGWIVRNTYDYATLPDVTNINYSGQTGVTITNIATADATYVLVNSGSTLYQQTTFPTPQQRRENIFLGKVVHPNRTSLLTVNNTVDYDVSPMSALRDLWSPIKLINQGVLPSFNTGLTFNTSLGTLYGNGIGWTTNQLNPNSVTISAKTSASFFYRTQTGGTSGSVSIIDPTKYDVNGVITSVGTAGSNDATNQRIYLYPTGVINVLYGQTRYTTLTEAIANIDSETFITYPNAETTAILIGVISVRNDIVADGQPLTNTNYAKLTLVSKFGESFGGTGGLSTTTLQQAYDNSVEPEIITNSSLGALTLQRGSASDADDVFQIQDGAGVHRMFVNASGRTTTTDLTITGVTSTSGLTRYLVVDTSGNTYHQTAGDMTLGSTQTNSGAKTFLDTTFLLRNVANTFNGSFVNTNTADRIYTLPDTDGTIALTSNLSSYVPYTGATANVSLGANSLFTTTLGVGISSSLSSTAHIRGTSPTTGSAFLVQNSTPANVFNVLNSGFVGVGSNTPISLLHIGTGSGTSLGDFTTPAITFNTLNQGIYLDSNRLFFKVAGAFNFGIDSTGVLGNGYRINGAASNNVTTPIFVPSRVSLGSNSGLGGNNAGDISLITSGSTRLRINYNGDLGFFGVTPVARQTLGAATAGATYTATEQGMLQRVYDALRNYGLGT